MFIYNKEVDGFVNVIGRSDDGKHMFYRNRDGSMGFSKAYNFYKWKFEKQGAKELNYASRLIRGRRKSAAAVMDWNFKNKPTNEEYCGND